MLWNQNFQDFPDAEARVLERLTRATPSQVREIRAERTPQPARNGHLRGEGLPLENRRATAI